MTIAYHSQNRKELVKAISEIIGIPAVYQFILQEKIERNWRGW